MAKGIAPHVARPQKTKQDDKMLFGTLKIMKNQSVGIYRIVWIPVLSLVIPVLTAKSNIMTLCISHCIN